jgi:Protein of unknown function (DUF2933).
MRSLLPLILLLACPVMMIFMMRGMPSGGHGTSDTGHDTHMISDGLGAPDGQASEEQIAQLEREVAQLRAVRGEHPEHCWAQQP